MEGRPVRRVAIALVALSAVAALLASTGVAAPRKPVRAPTRVERGLRGEAASLRAPRHLPVGTVAAPRQLAVALSQVESHLLGDINDLRARHGLAPLHLSAPLSAAARAHTQEMAADGYFEHESADGTAFWKRIQAFYPQGNRSSWSVGENLLYAAPDIDAQGALESWLESPPHRANLLSHKWHDIGVAVIHATDAPGEFHGQDVTLMTTDFGVRR